MYLPDYVKMAIDTLCENGFEAYAVGGCVRDALLLKNPHDYDVTTSALPEQIKKCFKGFKVIETGIKHGTVSVVTNKNIIEITTYRIDGEYEDNRHPKDVSFTNSLKDDLCRRDFTINAMAYNEKDGLCDFFGGRADLESKIIRCVGEAEERFEEDALRILRALRFAAVLGFKIEKQTEKAILKKKKLLKNISQERIREEFSKLIVSKDAAKIIERYSEVFAVFIPEIEKTKGVLPYNEAHIYDVFIHTLKAVEYAKPKLCIRLCMLFHDIGKPYCFTLDQKGRGHFYAHQKIGANICTKVLTRLRFDNKTIKKTAMLVNYHDGRIFANEKSVLRWLRRIGSENLKDLLEVKRADAAAHEKSYALQRCAQIDEIDKILDEVIEKNLCYNLKMLDFKGGDAIELGFTGKQTGHLLNYLLNAVIEKRCENENEKLKSFAIKYKEKNDI